MTSWRRFASAPSTPSTLVHPPPPAEKISKGPLLSVCFVRPIAQFGRVRAGIRLDRSMAGRWAPAHPNPNLKAANKNSRPNPSKKRKAPTETRTKSPSQSMRSVRRAQAGPEWLLAKLDQKETKKNQLGAKLGNHVLTRHLSTEIEPNAAIHRHFESVQRSDGNSVR